jgi:energy-coupling factor transporter ATP-binding protein EcfA2
LDETICGSGINEAKYGSLSGGEARSIDLAIQFAFLDIAKMKKGIFPDILLLDEILDSSIDGGGLNNILNIIKTKQYDENSKVFIITHRQEISDIDADNTYLITKKEGFSTIKKL